MNAKKLQHLIRLIVMIGTCTTQITFAGDLEPEPLEKEEVSELRYLSSLNDLDKLPNSEKPLNMVIKKALEMSPTLKEASFAVDAAEQEIQAAKGARYPQISISSNSSKYTGSNASNLPNGNPRFGITGSLPVYDFGRIDANINKQEAARDGVGERYTQRANQIANEVISTCLQHTKQRALLYAAQEYLATVQNLVDLLSKITDADTGRKAELVQASSRLLQAKQATENARVSTREFGIRLDRIIGPNNTKMCKDIGYNFLKIPEFGDFNVVVAESPEVKASWFEYQAAQRQLDQATASRKPLLQANASHGPLGLGSDYYQTFTLTLSMSVYDGKILESNERAALARTNAASERFEAVKKQIENDIRARIELAKGALRRANEYTGLLEVNNEVRKNFFVQWYALGRRSLFEILAMEQEQYNLKQGYFTSIFDGMIGIANVRASVGQLVPKEAQ